MNFKPYQQATGPLSLALKLNFLENGGIKRSRALLKVRFVAVFFLIMKKSGYSYSFGEFMLDRYPSKTNL